MTTLADINFNSAAMKNFIMELNPRGREPALAQGNLSVSPYA